MAKLYQFRCHTADGRNAVVEGTQEEPAHAIKARGALQLNAQVTSVEEIGPKPSEKTGKSTVTAAKGGGRRAAFTPEQRADAIRLIQERMAKGQTVKDAAKAVGVNFTSYYGWLKQMGAAANAHGKPALVRKAVTKPTKAAVAAPAAKETAGPESLYKAIDDVLQAQVNARVRAELIHVREALDETIATL